MPQITKFSIYEKETRDFIEALTEAAEGSIDKPKLTETLTLHYIYHH